MEKTKNGITEGVIWKQLLLFFFPILIGTFFQQLYNTVDTIIVGQFVGTEALAAVGTTGTVINLLVGFFVGVASGATVIISQYFGANDRENLSKSVHTSMALAVAGGIVIMVFGIVTARPTMLAMGVPDDIMDDAVLYMNVYYLGIIGNLIYNIGTGVLRAIGDSRMPLYVLIVCCLANVVLDLLFVVVFHILKNEVRIGLPAGLQSVMYSFSNILIQASINSFGTTAIAAWAAIGKIDGFIWMVMNAFGIAVTTFAGQNFGARQYDRMKRCTRVGLGMCLGTIIALSALLFIFRYQLLMFFTGDAEVVNIGAQFCLVLAPSYFTFVFIEILSGAIRGAGEALQPMLITCIGVCGLRVVWILLVVPYWHTMQMVAMNYPVSWVITAVIFVIYYLRGKWLDRCIKREHDPQHGTATEA